MKKNFAYSMGAFVLTWLVMCPGFRALAEEPPKEVSPEVHYIEELKLFSKAMGVIQEAFPEDIPPRKLLYEAVKGMMTLLDKYSEFIDPEKYELLKIHMKGEYASIGVMLKIEDNFPVIRGVQPDSSAMKAGLLTLDRIVKINNESMEGMDLPEVAKRLRGEADTMLTVTVFRVYTGQTHEFVIRRETIAVPSVMDVKMVGRKVGYLKMDNWSENTLDQVDSAVDSFGEQGMEALIIDLRNNSGGLMTQAVGLAERFLSAGTKILKVDSKIEEQKEEFFSSGNFTLKEYALVVLVNEKSASASEIFSAAMQDHGRATLVGKKTFGKGSVQSVIPLDDNSAMKMTTARYLSPSGRDINRVGIEPDYVIDNELDNPQAGDLQLIKAMDILKDYM